MVLVERLREADRDEPELRTNIIECAKTCLWRTRFASPLVEEVGVQTMRQRDADHLRIRSGALLKKC